jgi:exodeoxyribonuclease V alpha subunit
MSATITKAEPIEIAGRILQLFFSSEKFCAGLLDTKFGAVKFSVKGFVRADQSVTFLGSYEKHPKFGRQFVATEVVYKLPVDEAGLRHWLTWNIDSVGPVAANKLVDEFGANLPKLCQVDPGQVAATCGVSIEAVRKIGAEWHRHAARVALQSQLAGFGLTQHQVEIIADKFKSSAADVVKNRPYALLGEVDGLGFAKVDEIALKVGILKSDQLRAAAALEWVVRGGYYDKGHTMMPERAAICEAAELINEEADVEVAAAEMCESNKITKYVTDDVNEPNYFATPAAVKAERIVWNFLATASEPNPLTAGIDPIELAHVTLDGNIVLDESQSRAVRWALMFHCSVVTGGAGSGKTLVAKAIHRIFTADNIPVHLVAPTGKAARRLTEVIGVSAATIHRTLGFSPDGGFNHNEDNPLPDGLYIVDEVSMVDSGLMAAFLRALPKPGIVKHIRDLGSEEYKVDEHVSLGSAVVLIGDTNQLPPVGPGAVFRDILEHALAPATALEKCHRQAGTLKTNSAEILESKVALTDMIGEPPAWVLHKQANDAQTTLASVTKLYDSKLTEWGFDAVNETQFMTAMHKGELGTKHLNKLLQHLHQRFLGVDIPPPTPDDEKLPVLHVGDKVIHVKNNYTLGVMNGTVGIVESLHPLTVAYDDKTVEYSDETKGQVELAYVLTPHKMQGSEIPCAVVIVPTAHGFMQTKNWLYTACTRAKRTCVIVGDGDAIRRAAEKVDASRRNTLLSMWKAYPETNVAN